MPNPLSRTQAHRIRRANERLDDLLAELDLLPVAARLSPVPKTFAGHARRTLSEAAATFGLPAPQLDSPPTPAVILT